MSEFKRGMVPISADPITNGHIDLIRRAKKRCETLIVVIMDNDEKRGRYTFTLEERMKMSAQALEGLHGVMVTSWRGLLVDAHLRLGTDVVFRGIRNTDDETYERQLMAYHGLILPGFDRCVKFLPARQELREISSTMVKGFVMHGVDVSPYVPLHVKVALEERILGISLVGITGGIATGKSYVAERLASRSGGTHINVDQLVHDLYAENTHGARLVREQIAQVVGEDVLVGSVLNRGLMRKRLFGSPEAHLLRGKVQEITKPHVMRLLRARLKDMSGLIILEWAQLVEMEMMGLVNNRVIVVSADDYRTFLAKRGLTPEAIVDVAEVQLPSSVKVKQIQAAIERDGFGACLSFYNTFNSIMFEDRMRALLEQVKGL